MRPIPVATIEDPLKPLIGRGDVGVSPEESLLSNSVCEEAPASKINECSKGEASA